MGLPHSGTSILRRILGSHPDWMDHDYEILDPDPRVLPIVETRAVRESFRGWVCKTPVERGRVEGTVRMVEEAAETVGGAIDLNVIVVRDVRDVLHSMRERYGHWYSGTLAASVDHAADILEFLISFANRADATMIRLEDLVSDPSGALNETFTRLGVDADTASSILTNYYKTGTATINGHVMAQLDDTDADPINSEKHIGARRSWQINQPLFSLDKVSRWKTAVSMQDRRYFTEFEWLQSLLVRLGYPPDDLSDISHSE
mmetsp:Transcript_66023/g.155954  ORF Transcript_66023/g.155954 Transcript_66023/m.155954 type:complete len:260 (+) Transcript_66023:104-883(+)